MDQITSKIISTNVIVRGISALSILIILFLVLRQREKKPVHKFFLFFNLSLLAYLFPSFIQDLAVFSPYPPKWANGFVTYLSVIVLSIGINTASVHWLLTAASYSGKIALTRRWRRFALYIPTFIILFVFTAYSIHEISRETVRVSAFLSLLDGISLILSFAFGVWAFTLYLKTAVDIKEKVYNRQAITMTIGGCFILLGGILYFITYPLTTIPNESSVILLLIRFNSLDVGIFLANIVFAYALLKMGFLNILPVALHQIFHNMNDAILVLDIHLRIVESNSPALQIFPTIHPGSCLQERLPEIHSKLETLQKSKDQNLELEINLGDYVYWVRSIPLFIQHQPAGWILILTDITKRKRAEEQLAHDALHDRLTGLPNRTLFLDRLSQTLKHATRETNLKYAVLFLDLDRFKRINDSLGHQTGDQLLIQVAQRISSCIRAGDTVARLGGDEFVVLLEDIDNVRAATEVALRIQDALSEPLTLNGQQVFTSASIGIAIGAQRYHNPDDLLRDADIAMYQAKENGKSCCALFDQEMHARVNTLLQLETDLRKAVMRQEFVLHYQPIVSLEDHHILGFETLLRWQHPTLGLLHPQDFLPEAEDADFILPIGYWIIQHAISDLASWQADFGEVPPLFMTINLSRKQLLDANLFIHINDTLSKTNVPPELLVFEINEKVLLRDESLILDSLTQLKALGVRLFIDDFSTGYASLHVLPTYPFDTIKIDHSFICNITNNSEGLEIVRMMINLGKSLNKGIIAEGIETQEQLEKLISLDCIHGQGFYFHEPCPYAAIQSLFAENLQKEKIYSSIDYDP